MHSDTPEPLSRITPRTLLVAAVVVCAVLAAGLAATLLVPPGTTPVGLTTSSGDSMGAQGQQVVLYADLQPSVGDVVIFDAGPEHGLVRHRIVDATAQGFITRGDANSMVDQRALSASLDGMPYATAERIRGVSLVAVPVSLLEGVGAGLFGLVVVVGLWRGRREIGAGAYGFSRRVATGKGRKAVAGFMALLLVTSGLGGISITSDYSAVSNATAEIESATLVSTLDISTETDLPTDVEYNDDGTKMYLTEAGTDNVYEYSLSTPYDTSTASVVDSFSVGTQSGNPEGSELADGGTKLFIVDVSDNKIYQYSLSTAYDVSTASYQQSFDISGQTTSGSGIVFNSDGTKMFLSDNDNDRVLEYSLSTPYDVSTASFTDSLDVLSETGDIEDIEFNGDGSKLLAVSGTHGSEGVYEYTLSTGYDVSTGSYSGNFLNMSGDVEQLPGIDLGNDGKKMIAADWDFNIVAEYDTDISGYSSGYIVSGTVTDSDGNPLENVSVSDGNGNSTTTNATGQYSLTLANGTYDLTASKGTYVNATTTITVDGAPVQNVDLQLGTPLKGSVRNQNGEPVSNATVKMFGFNYTQLQLDGVCSTPTECREKASELREDIQDPTPQAWLDQGGENFTIDPSASTSTSFIEKAEQQDAVYPLVHSAGEWDVGSESLPHTGVTFNPNPTLGSPRPVFTPEERIVVSAWDPTKTRLINDQVTSDSAGKPVVHDLVIERRGAGGGVITNTTVTPEPFVRITNLQNLGSDTHEAYALGQLDQGFYKIYPAGSPERSYYFAVAPGGDAEEIYADAFEDLRTEAGALEARAQKIQDLEQQNHLEVKTTTTDSQGRFSFTFDSTTVKSVTLTAYKPPAAMENVDRNTTKQDIRTFFEGEVQTYKDRIREEYSLDLDPSTDPQQVDARLQELCGEATSELGNVVNDVGGGYASAGTTTVSPPDQGVTVDVVGAEVPTYVGSADRLCYDTAFQEFVRANNFSNLATWAMQNISDLTNSEVEELFADTLRLAEGSEQVCREFASEWGVDPEGECDGGLSDDNGDGVLGDSGDPDSGGGGTAPVPIPDSDGSIPDDVDGPTKEDLIRQVNALQVTIDQLRDSINSEEGDTEVGDGTISKCWAFDTDLSESQSLIKATYANGTTTTLTTDSEYVSVDNPLGPGDESLCLTEFPLGSNDPASVTFTAHVAGPDGIGRDTSVIRNPAFSGQLPNLEAVRLSTSSPGPSDRVSVELVPEDTTEFGSVTNVTVTRAGQQIPTEAVQNRVTAFTTNGSGTYRVKFTYTDADGNSYVQVVKVGAGRVAHQLPPTVRYQTGPTGGFAIVSNGLESSVIDIEQSGATVDVQAVIAASGDVPDRVAVHTQGIDLATESTTTVRMVRGANRQSVRQTTGVILHTIPLPDDATLYRTADGETQPLPLNGENRYAIVTGNNSQTTVEYVTAGDGVAGVKSDTNPNWLEANWYGARLDYGWLPFLQIQVTFWTGSGMTPAGAAAGGILITPLSIGLLLGRRWYR